MHARAYTHTHTDIAAFWCIFCSYPLNSNDVLLILVHSMKAGTLRRVTVCTSRCCGASGRSRRPSSWAPTVWPAPTCRHTQTSTCQSSPEREYRWVPSTFTKPLSWAPTVWPAPTCRHTRTSTCQSSLEREYRWVPREYRWVPREYRWVPSTFTKPCILCNRSPARLVKSSSLNPIYDQNCFQFILLPTSVSEADMFCPICGKVCMKDLS